MMSQRTMMGFGGTAPLAGKAEVEAILALSPLHYWEFRFPSDVILGQLLYQNSNGTTAVTAATDPVGWVKNLGSAGASHPFINPIAVNRPLYAGSSGLDMRIVGLDNKELYASSLTGVQYPLTTWASSKSEGAVDLVNDDVLWYAGSVGGLQIVGLLLPRQDLLADESFASVQIDYLASDFQIFFEAAPTTFGTFRSYLTQFASPTSCDFKINGAVAAGPGASLLANPTLTAFGIGGASLSAGYNGYIKALAVWNRTLTAAEITTLTGLV